MTNTAGISTIGWETQVVKPYKDGNYTASTRPVGITNVVGTVSDGNTLTITGAGFGAKATAAPWLFEDFEAGTLNGKLNVDDWVDYGADSDDATYSNTQAYSGSQSGRIESPDAVSTFKSVGQAGLNSKEMYFSAYSYMNKISGLYSTNTSFNKFWRFNADPSYYSTSPRVYMTTTPNDAGNDNFTDFGFLSGTADEKGSLFALSQNAWHRWEIYVRLSSGVGVADGECTIEVDGVNRFTHTSKITLDSGATSGAAAVIDNFLLPIMTDRAGVVQECFTDDLYMDNTQQRVEISLSSTWAAATSDKTIQIPTVWGATSIECTVRGITALGAGSKYLYVIDSEGNVNPNGYAI